MALFGLVGVPHVVLPIVAELSLGDLAVAVLIQSEERSLDLVLVERLAQGHEELDELGGVDDVVVAGDLAELLQHLDSGHGGRHQCVQCLVHLPRAVENEDADRHEQQTHDEVQHVPLAGQEQAHEHVEAGPSVRRADELDLLLDRRHQVLRQPVALVLEGHGEQAEGQGEHVQEGVWGVQLSSMRKGTEGVR